MQDYSGKSVFEGIAVGRIKVLHQKKKDVRRYEIEDIAGEMQRFERAKQVAMTELQELTLQATQTVGAETAAIFEVHQVMLADEEYNEAVSHLIQFEKSNVEYAVSATSDYFYHLFSKMEDAFMKERATDVLDVSKRLLRILAGEKEQIHTHAEPVILVAKDLVPSETIQLDTNQVHGIVTYEGSLNSHTAILARTMGIPAIVGTQLRVDGSEKEMDAFLETINGKPAVIDGLRGVFYVEPEQELLGQLLEQKKQLEERQKIDQELIGKEDITRDGRKIMLFANVNGRGEIPFVKKNDAAGIGLFRSEFLYLERDSFPTEEEQFHIYREVLEAMEGKKVIIRTFDLGADKQCDFLQLEEEENPALGLRGIRIGLMEPDILKTQLRALLRAAAYGTLAIMYPMITSVSEVQKVKAILSEAMEELRQEKLPFGPLEQGIMIETPAAVMISDLLACEVNFFSIGTNDLTQYTLAMDRQNARLEPFVDLHHEAILRMIRMVVENGKQAGIWTGICGELAADVSLTKTFLEMGVEELSVSPASIFQIRRLIREYGKEVE